MTTKIYSHNVFSEGARELSIATGFKRLKHQGSRWQPRAADTIINWGSSQPIPFANRYGLALHTLNTPQDVRIASNKLSFFRVVGDTARVPDWTTDRAVAATWPCTVARTVLNGHSGAGIVICERGVDIPNAPLYTRYVKKEAEYRVHIMNGEVIDVQKKIRDPEREPTNWHVRSHDNGFIFVRDGVVAACPQDVLLQAGLAFGASGLDFGAVDIIYNRREDRAYVLEINTAPGLTGQTVTNYAEAFKRIYAL